jgi:Glycosyltransferase family 87
VTSRRVALGGGLLLLLAACSLPWVGLWKGGGVADTGLYGLYGERMAHGLVPYRDFYVEFPPGALPALVLPALPGSHYVAWFHGLEFLFACGTLACLVPIVARTASSTQALYGAVGLAAVAPALLGPITLNSFDYWPAFLTTAAVALLVVGHRRSGFAVLGVATAAKLFPAGLLAVAFLLLVRRDGKRHWREAALAYVATTAAIFVPFAILGPGGLRFSLETQLRRGLQLESLGGALLAAAHHLAGYRPTYTPNLAYAQLAGPAASAAAALSSAAMVAAILLVAWLYARSRDDGAEGFVLASAATLVGIVAFAKVLSPQYLLWLVALVAAASVRVRSAAVLLALALGLTQIWVPNRFRGLQDMDWVTWVLLARDLALVALFAALVAELRARVAAAAPAGTPATRARARPWQRRATRPSPDRTA